MLSLSYHGHVKLADMGGVAEFAEGTCLEAAKVGLPHMEHGTDHGLNNLDPHLPL